LSVKKGVKLAACRSKYYKQTMSDLIEGEDFYFEGNLMVFTERFHLKRGHCCGSGCRHCPYDPKWTEGTTKVREKDPEPGQPRLPDGSITLQK